MKSLLAALLAVAALVSRVDADCPTVPLDYFSVGILGQDRSVPETLANGGTVTLLTLAEGTGGHTLDYVLATRHPTLGDSWATLPRKMLSFGASACCDYVGVDLEVPAGTTEVCVSVFAHPTSAACGSLDTRRFILTGSGQACATLVLP